VTTALGLVVNLATNTVQVTWRWWPAAVWTAVVILAVASVSEHVRQRKDSGARAGPAVLVTRASDELAGLVGRQWAREAGLRGLQDPLRVRWSSTDRLVAAPPGAVIGSAVGGRVTRLKLRGDVTGVAAVWRQLPARQLVVIGSPGAGKTSLAVLLVCALLGDRKRKDPVPVLLNPSGWNPVEEELDVWLAARLAEQYPALLDSLRFGEDAAGRLVDEGRILPVLDGLDEMPGEARAAAVTRLTEAVGAGSPLVLTCGSEEYQRAIEGTGTPLGRAAVLELEPVAARQAAEYLPAGQIDGRRRWTPVVRHLKECPDAALARALSTPLMVYLARTTYTRSDTDPAHLLTFTDPAEVEEHLLKCYLLSIYPSEAPRRSRGAVPRLHHYPPDKAEQWLAFLARYLRRHDRHELAWWQLIHAVPRHERVCGRVGGLIGGLAAGLAGGLVMGPGMGLVFGLMGGLLVVLAGAGGEGEPHIVRRRRRWKTAAGLLAWSAFSVLTLNIPNLPDALDTGPAEDKELLDPHRSLRNDRASVLVVGLAAGVILGLPFGLRIGLGHGLAAGLGTGSAFALTVGLGVGMQSAWLRFGIGRCWLAGRGFLPWRLMRFLDDAYRRGALRRSGAQYQFRHSRLRDHLAARDDIAAGH
jgi:hypothetical protein